MGIYLYYISRTIAYITQKKFVKLSMVWTHTKPLFEDVKILDIFQMNKYLIGNFMFNVYKSTSLDVFIFMFVYNWSIHAPDTRQSSHVRVPLRKKGLHKSKVSR